MKKSFLFYPLVLLCAMSLQAYASEDGFPPDDGYQPDREMDNHDRWNRDERPRNYDRGRGRDHAPVNVNVRGGDGGDGGNSSSTATATAEQSQGQSMEVSTINTINNQVYRGRPGIVSPAFPEAETPYLPETSKTSISAGVEPVAELMQKCQPVSNRNYPIRTVPDDKFNKAFFASFTGFGEYLRMSKNPNAVGVSTIMQGLPDTPVKCLGVLHLASNGKRIVTAEELFISAPSEYILANIKGPEMVYVVRLAGSTTANRGVATKGRGFGLGPGYSHELNPLSSLSIILGGTANSGTAVNLELLGATFLIVTPSDDGRVLSLSGYNEPEPIIRADKELVAPANLVELPPPAAGPVVKKKVRPTAKLIRIRCPKHDKC